MNATDCRDHWTGSTVDGAHHTGVLRVDTGDERSRAGRSGSAGAHRAARTAERSAHALTAKEFAILKLLVQSRGEVVSRNRILDEVWGADDALDARRIDTHIVNLRRKLEDDPAAPRFIQSVYGEGYRFAG